MAIADFYGPAAAAAERHGIPPDLFLALVKQESGFNPTAQSPVGAYGLTQLMPGTAAGLGVDPRDPMQNLEGGARYLADQYRAFGQWPLALAAYNAGPGRVQEYGGIPPFEETQNYVRSILGSGPPPPPMTPGINPNAPQPGGDGDALAALFAAQSQKRATPEQQADAQGEQKRRRAALYDVASLYS